MDTNYSLNSLFSLEGKTALVTGGSSGLGLIMAKAFIQNGVKVVISSRRREKCDLALAELKNMETARRLLRMLPYRQIAVACWRRSSNMSVAFRFW